MRYSSFRTGYLKHLAKYKSAVQTSPSIRVGQEDADGVDLSGKVVVITGANSGIGKDLATYAAAKGAKLYMFCRSKDRAEKARKEIVDATSSETVDIVLVDLVSEQKSTGIHARKELLLRLFCFVPVCVNGCLLTRRKYCHFHDMIRVNWLLSERQFKNYKRKKIMSTY